MDQNKPKCIDAMDKIKRKLDSLGLNTIMTSDKENILCKVSGDFEFKDNTNTINNFNKTVTGKCPATINSNITNCPYTACKYPNATCHLHKESNANNSNSTNTDNTNSNNSMCETLNVYSGSLFRIMPNDIHTGIFLHVIKLHGETCDLKMSFNYDNPLELVEIIKFLLK